MTVIEGQQDWARAPTAGASLLGALVIVARHRGIHLSQAQLRRDHQITADDPAPRRATAARARQWAEGTGHTAGL